MMRSDPHPSSTAEKSRFSMMAVTAIHQRRANAVARVGAMVDEEKVQASWWREAQSGAGAGEESNLEVTGAQEERSLIIYL